MLTFFINKITRWFFEHQSLVIEYIINIIIALLILILSLLFSKWIRKIINNIILFNKVDKTINEFLSKIIHYAIIIFAAITILNQFGLQTTSIIALLGAAGITIGLGIQNSLSNFAAGILLVFFRPFHIGETIIIGNIKGTVEHIQILFTILRTPNNNIIIIPNNRILNDNIINITRYFDKRIQIIISVAYNANIDFVKKIIKEVILLDKNIKHDKEITIRLHEMAPSSLNFIIRVWTDNKNAKNVYWDLLENLKKQLDHYKICIPYNQIDVHLHKTNK